METNILDLQTAACKVYSILTDEPDSRDDDRLLLAAIWIKELGDIKGGIKEFFDNLLEGKISNPETITRVRRKLQEKHSNLRGQKWESRHNMEGYVCQQLTFFDKW